MSGEKLSSEMGLLSVLKKESIDVKKIKNSLIEAKKVIIICGPTGIGKTKLGIELARLLNTDIISADSMQVYRGMDIGTDKLNSRSFGVKQYMVDLFEPDHRYTVKEFRDQASLIISDYFIKVKKIPIVVGGSGMYIKALIDGIDDSPGEDRKVRNKIEKDMDSIGLEKHYERLKMVDSEYAARISSNDKRRILRALEVYEVSGKPYSGFQKSWNNIALYNSIFIGLSKERSSLYHDIEKRVDRMFENGLVDEVEKLLKKGYGTSTSLLQAVGYKEVASYINGDLDLKECKRQVKQNSRRLAKKQMTWFRQDDRINWLATDNYDNIFDLIKDSLVLICKG